MSYVGRRCSGYVGEDQDIFPAEGLDHLPCFGFPFVCPDIIRYIEAGYFIAVRVSRSAENMLSAAFQSRSKRLMSNDADTGGHGILRLVG